MILDYIHKTEVALPTDSARRIVSDEEFAAGHTDDCVSQSLIDLMLQMLNKDAKARATVNELL